MLRLPTMILKNTGSTTFHRTAKFDPEIRYSVKYVTLTLTLTLIIINNSVKCRHGRMSAHHKYYMNTIRSTYIIYWEYIVVDTESNTVNVRLG